LKNRIILQIGIILLLCVIFIKSTAFKELCKKKKVLDIQNMVYHDNIKNDCYLRGRQSHQREQKGSLRRHLPIRRHPMIIKLIVSGHNHAEHLLLETLTCLVSRFSIFFTTSIFSVGSVIEFRHQQLNDFDRHLSGGVLVRS
jgi:hypothetical protein